MEIRCVRCGEPWDMDELHEMEGPSGEALPYKAARARFDTMGCEAFGTSHGEMNWDRGKANVVAAAQELMGDDTDGLASMLDDAEYLGLI